MRGIIIAAAALALAGCSQGDGTTVAVTSPSPTVSASPSPVVMTAEQAGERYLRYICKSNDANASLGPAGVSTLYVGDALTDQQKQTVRRAAAVNAKAARALEDSGYVWPEDVSEYVEKVAVQLYDDSAKYRDIVKSGKMQLMSGGSNRAANIVRLRLGLPPRGKGC